MDNCNSIALLEQMRNNIPLLCNVALEPYDLSLDISCALAPLDAHCNHKGTGFGGSIALLGTTMGWLHCARQIGREELPPLVIKMQASEYLAPLTADMLFVTRLTNSKSNEGQRREFEVMTEVINSHDGSVGAVTTATFVLLEDPQ